MVIAPWMKAIDELIVEKGEKKDKYYRAVLTTKEILQKIGLVITAPNHQNVRRVVEMQYPDSKFEAIGYNAQDGWRLHIIIRTN